MPVVELNAFSAHMEVLQAQESLRLSNIISIGAATMEKQDSERITRDWGVVSGANSARRRAARRNAIAQGSKTAIPGIGRA